MEDINRKRPVRRALEESTLKMVAYWSRWWWRGWLDSGYILKRESLGLANGLDLRSSRKNGIKDKFRFLADAARRMELPVGRAGVRGK